MKKTKSIFSLAFLLALLVGASQAVAAAPISIVVNGAKQTYSQPPIKENNSVLVPLRGIFESLQAQVDWNNQNQQITITKENKNISLKVGSKTAKVNDQSLSLTAAPKLVNGSTLVPLRFIGESLGAEVAWEEASQTVQITTQTTDGTNTKPNPETQQPTNGEQPQPNAPTKDQIVKAEYAAFLSQEAMKNKKYETALTKINEAINLDSSNYLYYYNRGLIYEALEQMDKAHGDFLKTTTLNAQYEPAYAKLAYKYLDQYKYDDALTAFSRAIELNPSNDEYYVKRAYILFNAKNEKDKAQLDIEKAIELSPKSKEYHMLLNKYKEQTFTEEEVNYFIEVTTGNDKYGTIKRWEDEMRVAAIGTTTPEDLAEIQSVANEINLLLNQEKIKVVNRNENPNVKIHFTRLKDFIDVVEEANDYSIAQSFVWNQDGNSKSYFKGNLNQAIILIAENRTDQSERNYLIRKKVAQALGLTHESWKYDNSIFNYKNDPKSFSELDKQLIKTLYYYEIEPGMEADKAKRVLLK